MYLQITTKCNMRCDHCCYSCGPKGEHMNMNTFYQAVQYIGDWDECISIGGGEPTVHPNFFQILSHCISIFDYVWMATNGKKKRSMKRLAKIIDGEDEEIYQEGKLHVDLSLDYFHEPIDYDIESYWLRRSTTRDSGYGIRDVTTSHYGVIKQGRAERTQNWATEGECVCSDLIIKPNGQIKICGCNSSPIIGDVWNGVEPKWEKVIQSGLFREADCYTTYKRKKRRKN